jgi:hypothetical protein
MHYCVLMHKIINIYHQQENEIINTTMFILCYESREDHYRQRFEIP